MEEIIPIFGVPEALLLDRGTNFLSHLMLNVCTMLGIQKLNTTAYHPQCNGLVERYNRTLKAMLRKHVARFGNQWDQFLYGVQWAYHNAPNNTTGEKKPPSYCSVLTYMLPLKQHWHLFPVCLQLVWRTIEKV